MISLVKSSAVQGRPAVQWSLMFVSKWAIVLCDLKVNMPRLPVVVIIYSHWDFLAQSMAIQLEKITINFKAYLS